MFKRIYISIVSIIFYLEKEIINYKFTTIGKSLDNL